MRKPTCSTRAGFPQESEEENLTSYGDRKSRETIIRRGAELCSWDMVHSVMNSIVCRSWLSVYFIFLFCPSYVNGEGSTCKLQSTGNCSNVIEVTIDEKSAKEETGFNLHYHPAGKKKLVAVLSYDKSYNCHPTNGYKCTKTTDVTFIINLGCETLQNVTLVEDGQQPVPCLPMENSPVESRIKNNYNCSACSNDTAPGNSAYHRRQKRCACPNESPESNAHNRERDDAGRERGNQEVNVTVVIIGIAVLLILSTIGLVLYCRRNSILSYIRKGYIPKYPHQGNEDL